MSETGSGIKVGLYSTHNLSMTSSTSDLMELLDIPYIQLPTRDPCREFDCYIPKNYKSNYILCFVHGGAWRSSVHSIQTPHNLTTSLLHTARTSPITQTWHATSSHTPILLSSSQITDSLLLKVPFFAIHTTLKTSSNS